MSLEAQVAAFALRVAFTSDAPVTALVGPSGAGKTLTLRAIAGLLRPDVGQIVVDGRVLLDTARKIDVAAHARRIGYVFQHHALFPHLDVAANIGFGLRHLSSEARRQRVDAMLDQVALSDRHARCDRLSGGERQRVALARALAPRPSLLLLDEPFASVDAPLRARLRQVVEAVRAESGAPALLVTHDPEDALALAQHVVVVMAGRVVDEGGLEVLSRVDRR